MTFFRNKKHFLHQHLTFLESTGIDGKDGKFLNFLADKGISTKGAYWNVDHSTIDWNKVDAHFQCWFDYESGTEEIKRWLRLSELKNYEFLLTWLAWDDPIIKIKTADLIENWEEFNRANGGQGLVLVTEDGKLFLEFTDDWKHHLNSNFEIKAGTK